MALGLGVTTGLLTGLALPVIDLFEALAVLATLFFAYRAQR